MQPNGPQRGRQREEPPPPGPRSPIGAAATLLVGDAAIQHSLGRSLSNRCVGLAGGAEGGAPLPRCTGGAPATTPAAEHGETADGRDERAQPTASDRRPHHVQPAPAARDRYVRRPSDATLIALCVGREHAEAVLAAAQTTHAVARTRHCVRHRRSIARPHRHLDNVPPVGRDWHRFVRPGGLDPSLQSERVVLEGEAAVPSWSEPRELKLSSKPVPARRRRKLLPSLRRARPSRPSDRTGPNEGVAAAAMAAVATSGGGEERAAAAAATDFQAARAAASASVASVATAAARRHVRYPVCRAAHSGGPLWQRATRPRIRRSRRR